MHKAIEITFEITLFRSLTKSETHYEFLTKFNNSISLKFSKQ